MSKTELKNRWVLESHMRLFLFPKLPTSDTDRDSVRKAWSNKVHEAHTQAGGEWKLQEDQETAGM